MGVKLHQHTQLEGAPACKPVSIEAAKKWSCRNDRNDTWLMGSSWLMDADLRSNLMEGFTSFLFKSWLDNQLCGQGCNHQNFINLPSTPWIRNPDLPVISQCIEHHNCWNTANIWVKSSMASFPELCQSEKRHFSFLRCLLGPPTNLGRAFQSALGASNINAEVEPQRGWADGDGAIFSRCRAWNPWILQWAPFWMLHPRYPRNARDFNAVENGWTWSVSRAGVGFPGELWWRVGVTIPWMQMVI